MEAEFVVGVDGTKSGWVGVVLQASRFRCCLVEGTLTAVLARCPATPGAIAVDIPIGFSTAGVRQADLEARRILRVRGGSVFPAPVRAAAEASSYADALAASSRLTGKGLSRQSYALAPKILEVDELAAHDDRIYEVHPEVSFTEMGDGPVGAPKKSWNGQMLRRRLLAESGVVLPDDLGESGRIPSDDILDAAAAAWTATRIVAGSAQAIPETSEFDARGRRIAIWA